MSPPRNPRRSRAQHLPRLAVVTLLLLGSAFASAAAPRTLDWMDLLTDADREAMLTLPPIDHGNGNEEADPLGGGGGAGDADGPVSLEEQIAASLDRSRTTPSPALSPAQQAAEAQWQAVLTNARVRTDLDGAAVRLPGFVVPLTMAADGKVTEFFLVPYFGACIHVPPPPPNQIVHVAYPAGYALPDLYTPVWISGTLRTRMTSNDVADAAYHFEARTVELYEE